MWAWAMWSARPTSGSATRPSPFSANTEKTNQFDVGALFTTGKWHGSVSTFYAKTKDYILVPNASNTSVKNVDAHTLGGEAELSYQFLPSWTVEATAAYVRGYNDSENKALAQTPPLDTSLGVKYDDRTFLGGLLLRAVAGQDRVDVGWGNIISRDLGETGGFAILSANAGWRVREDITLTGGVDNILGKNYAEHVSKTGSYTGTDLAAYSDNVRVNEPGRTFWMKGTVKF
jgi:iron complex outermembrane receptor protein